MEQDIFMNVCDILHLVIYLIGIAIPTSVGEGEYQGDAFIFSQSDFVGWWEVELCIIVIYFLKKLLVSPKLN